MNQSTFKLTNRKAEVRLLSDVLIYTKASCQKWFIYKGFFKDSWPVSSSNNLVPKPGFMFKTTTYTSQQQDITHTKKVKTTEKFLGKKEKLSEKVNCDLAVVHYGSEKKYKKR